MYSDDTRMACRRCGNTFRWRDRDSWTGGAWCRLCISGAERSPIGDAMDGAFGSAAANLYLNSQDEFARAKRWRMARRRGFRNMSPDGDPIPASEAYQGGRIEGYLEL
jgi:hypothetical protein